MSERSAVGVVGVGWVGLVTAACFAELGTEIVALDIDENKIEALRSGSVPMHEPGIVAAIAAGDSERAAAVMTTHCDATAALLRGFLT